jgi:hypothetical protein
VIHSMETGSGPSYAITVNSDGLERSGMLNFCSAGERAETRMGQWEYLRPHCQEVISPEAELSRQHPFYTATLHGGVITDLRPRYHVQYTGEEIEIFPREGKREREAHSLEEDRSNGRQGARRSRVNVAQHVVFACFILPKLAYLEAAHFEIPKSILNF